MADQAINALSTKTAPETSDQLLLVGAGEPQLIDYDKLADAILNKITSKNYALDAGTMTLTAALNALNGNSLSQKIENITQLPDGNKVKLISIGGSGIDVGSTGEKIPSWSFGIFLPSSGGSDACLLCANSTQITLAYKSSGVKESDKMIILSESGRINKS